MRGGYQTSGRREGERTALGRRRLTCRRAASLRRCPSLALSLFLSLYLLSIRLRPYRSFSLSLTCSRSLSLSLSIVVFHSLSVSVSLVALLRSVQHGVYVIQHRRLARAAHNNPAPGCSTNSVTVAARRLPRTFRSRVSTHAHDTARSSDDDTRRAPFDRVCGAREFAIEKDGLRKRQ